MFSYFGSFIFNLSRKQISKKETNYRFFFYLAFWKKIDV